ncbi:tRNA-specific adenosine deaminase [Lindgomyces ingoldianus]|uniref:tRNA-specific adenosine deaminase n=1 Tax=Lindgomyces ingoldianus TaxID=673940 RepID=A0ACB6RCS3_9PLEO|nr:tRNA-specific adenosine deaminase [Lindgomyces ingoldianus]KAF2476897.1 tRNA-specific adenosine deaminase [Lindgomyces ingoldianus]
MKCLPSAKLLLAHGNILHDWHAEVLAIRAFNRFILDECRLLSIPPYTPSRFVRRRRTSEITEAEYQPFAIKDDVSIHMYCSEAPCGDASMELVMNAQEDSTPWTSPPPTVSSEDSNADPTLAAIRGRSHFGLLGAVRLKPARPDAPPALSKSCTDKLALAQCTSILSSLSSLLITPRNAYLSSLVLPKSQHVEAACTRAFSRKGRMSAITPEMETRWKDLGTGYGFHPFKIQHTGKEFKHSRRSVRSIERSIPSNLSAIHTPHVQETLIAGVLQGRKQFDPRGASAICRRSIWKVAIELVGIVGVPMLIEAARKSRYGEVKNGEVLAGRITVKREAMNGPFKGWLRNTGDDDFGVET